MQSFQIVGEANQVPFGCDLAEAAQEELPEAECLFDDSENRFDRAGTSSIQRATFRGFEFGGHGQEHRVGDLSGRRAFLRRPIIVAPFGVSILAMHTDVEFGGALLRAQLLKNRAILEATIRQSGGRGAQTGGNGLQARHELIGVTHAGAHPLPDNQLSSVCIHDRLGIVALGITFTGVLAHEMGVGVGQIDLFIWFRRLPRWFGLGAGASAFLARRHLAFVLRSFVLRPGLRAFLEFRAGGIHLLQQVLSARDLLGHVARRAAELLGHGEREVRRQVAVLRVAGTLETNLPRVAAEILENRPKCRADRVLGHRQLFVPDFCPDVGPDFGPDFVFDFSAGEPDLPFSLFSDDEPDSADAFFL